MDNEKVRLLMRTLSGTFIRKLVDAHVHAQTHKQLWPEAKYLLKRAVDKYEYFQGKINEQYIRQEKTSNFFMSENVNLKLNTHSNISQVNDQI